MIAVPSPRPVPRCLRCAAARFACVAFVLAALAACTPGEGDPAADDLSLVWISLDTLRADHLSLYGYERETSPFLDDLARRGAYVEWAVSPQTATLPTHMTQFTGFHPVVHGVMHAKKASGIRLAQGVRTLPEVLRDAGFRTRAWVDGGQMDGRFGFARGFEVYDDRFSPVPAKLAQAREWIATLGPDERFFVFVQTYEIHAPYAPPPAYRRRFVTPGERDLATRSSDLYDGSIRFSDDALRAFVSALDAAGRLNRTVFVVTGDHGEGFAEYGLPVIGHSGRVLRQGLTRVPWIVWHPSPRMHGRVVETAGLVDFANTTLSLLGLEERMPGDGVDVFDAQAAAALATRDYVSWAGPKAWSLQRGRLHYLESELPGPARNGLFDVAADPREERALEGDPRATTMAARLATERARLLEAAERLQPTLREDGRLDADLADQLRALGYAVGPDDPDEPGEEAVDGEDGEVED